MAKMKVKALKVGEHPQGVWRQPGKIFELEDSKKFSEIWMEKVTAKEAKEAADADPEESEED